ncbi:hypothetical protein ACWDA9_42450, partial [Streptomyces sp. NPDC001193]
NGGIFPSGMLPMLLLLQGVVFAYASVELCGVHYFPARVFTLWQVIGGLVWTVGLVLAGYGLGSSVPDVDRYLLPIVALVVLVSLAPLAVEVIRRRGGRTSNGSSH